MTPVVSSGWSKNCNSRSGDPTKAAERELAAFFNAVNELFGREQAELSAEDWLRELAEIEGLPASTGEWRSITARASARLATRVNASSLSTEFMPA